MTGELVRAKSAFCAFFTIEGKEGLKWLEIPANAAGTLSDRDHSSGKFQKVTFDSKSLGSVSVRIAHDRSEIAKADHVWHELLEPRS
jgi:hypothetical protein